MPSRRTTGSRPRLLARLKAGIPELHRQSFRELLRLAGGHVKVFLAGASLGAVGLYGLYASVKLPPWAFFTASALILVLGFYRAFHDVRMQRDEAREQLRRDQTFPSIRYRVEGGMNYRQGKGFDDNKLTFAALVTNLGSEPVSLRFLITCP